MRIPPIGVKITNHDISVNTYKIKLPEKHRPDKINKLNKYLGHIHLSCVNDIMIKGTAT